MPHAEGDRRYDHLPLVRVTPTPPRRKQTPPPAKLIDPTRRAAQGADLRAMFAKLENEARAAPPPPADLKPHLLFRIPVASGKVGDAKTLATKLEGFGVSVVSTDSRGHIVAFQDDITLETLIDQAEVFAAGPKGGVNPKTGKEYLSTASDFFDLIDVGGMQSLTLADRVGAGLAGLIGVDGDLIEKDRLYVVDVELWCDGRPGTRDFVREVEVVVGNNPRAGERVRDEFKVGMISLAKVSVYGDKLARLLELKVVAEIDAPPTFSFDPALVAKATEDNFPTPPRPVIGGPSVCVIDSGVAPKHPLLANNVGHYESVHTATKTGVDECGHGTMVSAIAVFGDVRRCYETGVFASDITLYSARVLNEKNEFDNEELFATQVRKSIELFRAEPYNCRVFNISIGRYEPHLRANTRQGPWAEVLDTLARECKVTVVVSAGNHGMGRGRDRKQAAEVVDEYPQYLVGESECGLCDPATSAIAVTVGGIAGGDEPAIPPSTIEDEICRPIAKCGEPYPGSRVGPGINGAIKPEFVDYAGNTVLQGAGLARAVAPNDGTSVMSFAYNWATGNGLFAFNVGTSFAAPAVSRVASLVTHRLQGTLGNVAVDPNAVRAVLATAASMPQAASGISDRVGGEQGVRRIYGYGSIDEDLALNTGDRRTTLVAQDKIEIDTCMIYELPITPEFINAEGRKSLVVGLAYDPPVRSRRANYLGVTLCCDIIRGKTIDEVVKIYEQVKREERSGAPKKPTGGYRCNLIPGEHEVDSSTLHRRSWEFERKPKRPDDTYYLVVTARRVWAPRDVVTQDFGLAVAMVTEAEIALTASIRARLQTRARARQSV